MKGLTAMAVGPAAGATARAGDRPPVVDHSVVSTRFKLEETDRMLKEQR